MKFALICLTFVALAGVAIEAVPAPSEPVLGDIQDQIQRLEDRTQLLIKIVKEMIDKANLAGRKIAAGIFTKIEETLLDIDTKLHEVKPHDIFSQFAVDRLEHALNVAERWLDDEVNKFNDNPELGDVQDQIQRLEDRTQLLLKIVKEMINKANLAGRKLAAGIFTKIEETLLDIDTKLHEVKPHDIFSQFVVDRLEDALNVGERWLEDEVQKFNDNPEN